MSLTRFRQRIAAHARTWVAQPDSWCGLDCTYCYVPDRDKRKPMPRAVVTALAASAFDATADGDVIDLVWHAGEPLGVGIRRFGELVEPFDELQKTGRVRHCVQTNATMITDAWCGFLADHGFTVGVSIDGPAHLNAQRVDLRGRPSFDRALRGINRLRQHGIPFSIIAVVTTDSVAQPEALLDFLVSLGPTEIGLNIEETEGVNQHRSTPTEDQAREFWFRTIAWSRHHPEATVRETSRLGGQLQHLRECPDEPNPKLDPIPTVASNGDVVLLSPELAGTTAPTYDDFRAGNILHQPMGEILAAAHRLSYVREFLDALDTCETTCEFWAFCHGAQAGNRFFEHGRLDVAETHYCRTTKQALVQALSDTVREEINA